MVSALHLDSLVKVQRYHFLHAVLDHLRGEEVGFALFVNGDLPEIFQQNGTDSLGGMGHIDGSIVAHHLTHEGQSTTVVQVEMAGRRTGVTNVNTPDSLIYSIHINRREKRQYIVNINKQT